MLNRDYVSIDQRGNTPMHVVLSMNPNLCQLEDFIEKTGKAQAGEYLRMVNHDGQIPLDLLPTRYSLMGLKQLVKLMSDKPIAPFHEPLSAEIFFTKVCT